MPSCLGEQRHCGGEKQREHDHDPDGCKNILSIPKACQTVHSDHRKDQKDEDDGSDNQADEFLNTRRGQVSNVFVLRLALEIWRTEGFLQSCQQLMLMFSKEYSL